MTQVPLFSQMLLKQEKQDRSKVLYIGWAYRKFRKVLTTLLHYKTLILIVSVLLLAAAAFNFNNIKKTFFPDFNYNQVYIEYKLPAGAGPQMVQDDLSRITQHLLSLDEVKQVVSSQGQTPTRYCLVRPMGEAADNYGELIVDFEDYETMTRMKPVLSDYLHNNFPDARTRIRKYNLSIKASHTVEVEFTGADPSVLRDLSRQAQGIFRDNPFADPYTIEDDWEHVGQALIADFNQQAATRAGVTRSDVGNAILAATDGLPVGEYFEGQTRVKIIMKIRNADGSCIEDLENIPVWRMMPDISGVNEKTIHEMLTGVKSTDELIKELVSPVPLSSVTQGVDLNWEEQVVRRVNGQRAIQVQCEPVDGYSPALVRKTMLKDIEAIHLPDGYNAVWVGEQELQGDALRNIFR